ncbi:hypothetical protein ZWY2020_014951, partial [Hordeum vulgare]
SSEEPCGRVLGGQDDGNVFEWQVTIIGPPKRYSEPLTFCPSIPRCVHFFILHPPGDDPNGYELLSERWTPVHTVESIVLSIISMLSSPNDLKDWREKRAEVQEKGEDRCSQISEFL